MQYVHPNYYHEYYEQLRTNIPTSLKKDPLFDMPCNPLGWGCLCPKECECDHCNLLKETGSLTGKEE
jgi:hypothetical protein